MFFKVFVFMKKVYEKKFFKIKLHLIATYTQNCIKLHKILAQNLFFEKNCSYNCKIALNCNISTKLN